MASSRTGWIGVDVGTHAVKLAQLERAGSRFHLRAAMIVPRSESWRTDDLLRVEPASSAQEIRAGLTLGQRFSGRQAACTLPMQLCDVRTFADLPRDDAARRDTIAGELQTLGLDQNVEREFDYWDAEVPGNDGASVGDRQHVLSVARAWTMSVARDVSQAGLRCRLLDGVPLALARAVEMTAPRDAAGPTAVLDWGFASSTFCLIHRGSPCFVRTLPGCGFRSAVHAVREAIGISPEEANTVLRDFGLPSSTHGDSAGADVQTLIGEVMADSLRELSDELERTFSFVALQHRGLQLNRLLLCGGGATVRNVAEWLSHRLKLSVRTWQFSEEAAATSSANGIPSSLLATAIGLSALAWVNP